MDNEAKNFFTVSLFLTVLGILFITYCSFYYKPYDCPIFMHFFILYDKPMLYCFLLVLAAGLLLRQTRLYEQLLENLPQHLLFIYVILVLLIGFLHYFVYKAYPLSMDEYCFLFQAKIFAHGHLVGDIPVPLQKWAINPSFISVFINAFSDGGVVSRYWPGFSVMLALFVKLGVPWLLNALMAAGVLALMYYICLSIFPGQLEIANWCLLFTLASPDFIVNAISFYPNTAYIFLHLCYIALLLDPKPLRVFLAAVCGSWALTLHNPFVHTVFALPWIVWIMLRPNRFKNILMLVMGYLPLLCLFGIGWLSFRAIPNAADITSQEISQFGVSITVIFFRLMGAIKIWGWAVPGLVVLAAMGWWKNRNVTIIKLLAFSCVTTFFAYMIVDSDQGHGWGYRYFEGAWMVLPICGASFFANQQNQEPQSFSNYRSIFYMMATFVALSLFFCVPLRLWQVNQHMDYQLNQIPKGVKNAHQIIFVPVDGFYNSDNVHNDPFLRNKTIYFASRGRKEDIMFMQSVFPHFKTVSQAANVWIMPHRQKITEFSPTEKILLQRWGYSIEKF